MPYYSKPAADKSAVQKDCNGKELEFQPFGFAYNRPFLQEMLREQMGFDGYINSDTGIVHNMSWGVEMLDIPEQIGLAVNHAGVDLISGLFENPYRDPQKAVEAVAEMETTVAGAERIQKICSGRQAADHIAERGSGSGG